MAIISNTRLRQLYLLTMNVIIVGAILFTYTSAIEQVETTQDTYILLGATTLVFTLYVILAIGFDRTARFFDQLAKNTRSIEQNVNSMVEDDDS